MNWISFLTHPYVMFRLLNGNVMPWNVLWVSEVVSQYWERKMMIKFWRGLSLRCGGNPTGILLLWPNLSSRLDAATKAANRLLGRHIVRCGPKHRCASIIYPLARRWCHGENWVFRRWNWFNKITHSCCHSVLTAGAGSATDTVEEFLMKT